MQVYMLLNNAIVDDVLEFPTMQVKSSLSV